MNVLPSPEGRPFLKGRVEFERFFGDLALRRRSWRSVAVLALSVNLVLTIGFVRLAHKRKVVPYIVELDALGQTRAVGKLTAVEAPERAVIAALRQYVHNLRTIPSDAHILNTQLNAARSFATGRALDTFMLAVREERDLLERMLQRGDTRYVEEISGVLKVPGEARVYRVTWRERSSASGEEAQTAFEGHFQIKFMTPESEDQIWENPMGIFVTDYTLSRLSSIPKR